MTDAPRRGRWAVWWWRADHDYQHDVPVPFQRTYARLEDALRDAVAMAEGGRVDWVRVFHVEDESDQRLRWSAEDGYTILSRSARVERDRHEHEMGEAL